MCSAFCLFVFLKIPSYGTKILKEIRYDSYNNEFHEIYYHYDENNSPVGFSLNDQDYFFYKNIFGDVLGIVDSNGMVIVRYSYDAWGNPISVSGSQAGTIGQLNPFRYRGYYYDTESGFYYLNARYYNPEWGRFISSDEVLDTSSAVGCNLFAYCGNDPVNRVDESGCFWGFVFDVISLVSSIIDVCQNPDDPWAWAGLAGDALDLLPMFQASEKPPAPSKPQTASSTPLMISMTLQKPLIGQWMHLTAVVI